MERRHELFFQIGVGVGQCFINFERNQMQESMITILDTKEEKRPRIMNSKLMEHTNHHSYTFTKIIKELYPMNNVQNLSDMENL